MPSIACSTGHLIEGADEEELLRAMRAHVDEAHPELALADAHIRDYVAAALRMQPLRERVTTIGMPQVRELTTDLLDDYLRYFDYEAFPDNPAWASCYCMFYLHGGTQEDWSRRTAADNRAGIGSLIEAGRAHGYLAYVDGRPVGWCNAAPRTFFPGFEEQYQSDRGERVGSIVCFVIAPSYRRHGIARLLLDAACEGFRRGGFTHAEAYPVKEAQSDASAYHGPLAMYLDAGFEPVGEHDNTVVVRKPLPVAGGGSPP